LSEKKNVKKSSRPAGAVSGSPMDVGLLQKIVDLMAVNDLNAVDVREGDKRIIIKRGPQNVVAVPVAAAPPVAMPVPAAGAATATSAKAAAAEEDSELKPITSPMVGTFYAAPSPDAKPFVSVGSVVDEDTDVCIIEAMKVFNNIKAETRGTVVKILVENGQSVEFGQTLFLVKPA
jgi:acetyl-CoA carboxylase biotin carboxyl carrier protein